MLRTYAAFLTTRLICEQLSTYHAEEVLRIEEACMAAGLEIATINTNSPYEIEVHFINQHVYFWVHFNSQDDTYEYYLVDDTPKNDRWVQFLTLSAAVQQLVLK